MERFSRPAIDADWRHDAAKLCFQSGHVEICESGHLLEPLSCRQINMMKLVWQFSAVTALLVSVTPGSTIKGAPRPQNASTVVAATDEKQRPGFQTAQPASSTARPASAHDGQHDFDFMIGSWKSHVRRLQKPLTGSTSWIEGDATVSVRKIWNGRGNLEEIELTTPAGHLEGLTLRLVRSTSAPMEALLGKC